MNIKISTRPLIWAAAASLAVLSTGAYVWHEENRPAVLEVYLFSLKGSQVVFIRTPEDKRILINGGATGDVIQEITKILPFYSRRIDMVIATQDDAHHVSGLVDVISRYLINEAYIPAVTLNSLGLASTTDPAHQAFLNELNEIRITPQLLRADDSIFLDSQVEMNVLFPATSSEFVYSKASAPELLWSISFGSTSIAFLGNATPKIQKYIASTSADILGEGDSRVLVIDQSLAPGNIAAQLIEEIQPNFLIYSQVPPKGTAKMLRPKKPIVDPLTRIPKENKYNLQESRILKVVSDGVSIRID